MKPVSSVILFCAALAAAVSSACGTSLYFNPSSETGSEWSDANQWSSAGFEGPFDANWSDGSVARFRPAKSTAVDLAGDMIDFGKDGGIVNEAQDDEVSVTIRSSAAGAEVVFGGCVINAGATNARSVSFSGKVSLSGDFNLVSGSLGFYLAEGEVTPYAGTATVAGGLLFVGPGSVGPESDLTATEKAFGIYNDAPGEYTVGEVQIDAGAYFIGVSTEAGIVQTTMGALKSSGTAGSVQVRKNRQVGDLVHALKVSQETDAIFSGNLYGDSLPEEDPAAKTNYFSFEKAGGGNLVLNGTVIRLPQGTVISGGGLYIDDPESEGTRAFGNLSGGEQSAAITVAPGGTLGGSSLLRVQEGRNVVIAMGGALAPGSAGLCGVTAFEFTSGLLDLSAAAGGSGWLRFDLGAVASSDQINVVGGSVRIGDGLLDLDDFSFTVLPGCSPGEYVLISLGGDASLDGKLGPKSEGPIAPGFGGRLFVRGSDVVLKLTRVP